MAIGSAYASRSPPYVPASSSRRRTSTHRRTSRSLHSTSVVSCARALSSSLALMPCTVRQPNLEEEEDEEEAERNPALLMLPVLSGLAVTVLALDAVIEPEPVAECASVAAGRKVKALVDATVAVSTCLLPLLGGTFFEGENAGLAAEACGDKSAGNSAAVGERAGGGGAGRSGSSYAMWRMMRSEPNASKYRDDDDMAPSC